MKMFTYENYLNYKKLKECNDIKNTEKHNLQNNNPEDYYFSQSYNSKDYDNSEEYDNLKDNENLSMLNETPEQYAYKVNNEHDKVFRKILSDSNEAVKLINKALNLKNKLRADQIEIYNSSFITQELENRESDIVYKLIDKNIFFLIEHQTLIDYSMPYRILEYEYEIIKSTVDKKKLGQKEYQLPTVIPIVLYTGRKSWKAKINFKDMQEQLLEYKGTGLGEYNLVDVNEYSEEELLKEESFLTKAMLIEKASYTDKIVDYLLDIAEEMNKKQNIYLKEQKDFFKIIVDIVLKRKLTQEETERINKKLKGKGSDNMLAVEQMIIEENRRIFRAGKREEKKETAKKMKKKGIDIETIMEITGLSKDKIEKLA